MTRTGSGSLIRFTVLVTRANAPPKTTSRDSKGLHLERSRPIAAEVGRRWKPKGELRPGATVCLAILLLYLVASTGRGASSQEPSGPEKVSVCQLAGDRARYNHKLVEVTGFIAHGFEDFSVFDPACENSEIWLDYGGKAASGTMYCCPGTPNRGRATPLVVEGIEIPLADDKQFRSFDRLIHAGPDTVVVHATVVGRFFSGRLENHPNSALGRGYGHMGCCSLLAIERVVSVDPQDRDDVDYRNDPDTPSLGGVGCSYGLLEPLVAPIEAQHEADAGDQRWSFTDPKQVATETLARLLNLDEKSISGMTAVRMTQGRTVYKWRPHSRQTGYMVVVSRPYWLSFYAADPKKVAWVVIAAYESSCVK